MLIAVADTATLGAEKAIAEWTESRSIASDTRDETSLMTSLCCHSNFTNFRNGFVSGSLQIHIGSAHALKPTAQFITKYLEVGFPVMGD